MDTVVLVIVDGSEVTIDFTTNDRYLAFWEISVKNGADFEAYFWRQFSCAFCLIR